MNEFVMGWEGKSGSDLKEGQGEEKGGGGVFEGRDKEDEYFGGGVGRA